MSAYDVAIVARNLIRDYPQVWKSPKPTSTFAGLEIHSTNYMLEGMPAYRGGIDGLKTGTTDKAGASFVGTTVEKGMRIITVVLNADQQDTNPYARFTATSALLDYISANFALKTVVQKGEAYNDSKVTVLDGKEDNVTAVAKSDISIVQRIGSGTTPALQFTPKSTSEMAPLEEGKVVGTLTYDDPGFWSARAISLTDKPSFEMVF